MKRFYVENLREGTRVDDVFLITSKSVLNARNGSPYLRLKLADKTGAIDGFKWDATEADAAGVSEDDFVFVHGTVKLYNGGLQLTIDSCRKVDENIDPTDFIASSKHDLDEMMAELEAILAGVADPSLRQLLDVFFSGELASKFRECPAATRIHHAYIGGLVEHSLNVVRMCAALSELYPDVDRDLLLTAAALHDVGKIEEFDWTVSPRMSDAGHMVGHVVGGTMMVREAANGIDGFDPILNLALQHAILSHHGLKEYGSPKQPKSLEALILHCADDLDAKVAIFKQAIDDANLVPDNSLFTKRHHLLERPIFKGLPARETPETPEPVEEFDSDLFSTNFDDDPFADD